MKVNKKIGLFYLIITMLVLCALSSLSAKELYFNDVIFNDDSDVPKFENQITKPTSKAVKLSELLSSLDRYYAVEYSNNNIVNYRIYEKGLLKSKYEFYSNILEKITTYQSKGQEVKIELIDRAWTTEYYKSISETKKHTIIFESLISPSTPEYIQENSFYFKVYKRNGYAYHYEYYVNNKCKGLYSFWINKNKNILILKKSVIYNDLTEIDKIIHYNPSGSIRAIVNYNSYNKPKDVIKINNNSKQVIPKLDIKIDGDEE